MLNYQLLASVWCCAGDAAAGGYNEGKYHPPQCSLYLCVPAVHVPLCTSYLVSTTLLSALYLPLCTSCISVVQCTSSPQCATSVPAFSARKLYQLPPVPMCHHQQGWVLLACNIGVLWYSYLFTIRIQHHFCTNTLPPESRGTQ